MRLHGLIVCAALAACSPAPAPQAEAPPAPAVAPSLAAEGQAQMLQVSAPDDSLQWAASVVRVDFLQNQEGAGAKLFGVAAGDPAMNGLYTYIAFFQGPGDGWRIFRIGDFLDYRVIRDTNGRLDLELRESTMDTSSGQIGERTHYVIVTWARAADGTAPTVVSVTAARVEG